VEDYVKRKRLQVPAAEPTEQSSSPASLPLSADNSAPVVSSREQAQGEQSRSQKQDLWEQAHRLHEQGYGIRTIAKLLGLARNTVRRYLKMEEDWQAAPRPRRRSLLDPYRDYVLTRWMAGEHTGTHLTREIRSQGYQGCDTLVREVTTYLRKTYPDVVALPRQHPTSQPGLPLPHLAPTSSPRQIHWLLAKKREALGEEEQEELTRLLEGSEEVCLLYRLLQAFRRDDP
jgi:transposase